jgi:hypothetical protein
MLYIPTKQPLSMESFNQSGVTINFLERIADRNLSVDTIFSEIRCEIVELSSEKVAPNAIKEFFTLLEFHKDCGLVNEIAGFLQVL